MTFMHMGSITAAGADRLAVSLRANGDANQQTGTATYAGMNFQTNGYEYEYTSQGTNASASQYVTGGDSSEVWIRWTRTGGTLSDWNSLGGGYHNVRRQVSSNVPYRLIQTVPGFSTIIGYIRAYDAASGGNLLDTGPTVEWKATYVYEAPEPGPACFTGNMLVLMADGTEKPIADILMGDMVMSLNTETNQLEGARVYSTMVPRICNIYKIKLSNGKTVETTIEHPFRTADGRWANIDPTATYQPTLGGKNVTPSYVDAQLHEGMLLRGAEGSAKITKIIDTGRIETVYHLSRVGGHHNFFVEGMCVHNISQENEVKN